MEAIFIVKSPLNVVSCRYIYSDVQSIDLQTTVQALASRNSIIRYFPVD
jgi:hypothetical protein